MQSKRVETVLAGYEVGTGDDVNVPLRNTVITGQTQEAGKSTTLEALIMRSGLRAVAFRTKRGEQAFANAREIDPYFSDAGDWQFVASILEAARSEKLKFERAWIIKASRGATTLAQVRDNVKRELKTARGISESVYTVLDAYLDAVVPQIERLPTTESVDLQPGLNVMDLVAYSIEMQSLVMRSVLEWVHERETGVVTIIPEAWEFLPQSRGSPVKLAIERLARKGSGLKNLVWLDSQDLGGVHKDVVRSLPVAFFGVQREANEIKRTLANIPAGMKKPPASELATLELGEFFVCHGKAVIKTYIRPAWMNEADARAIARGTMSKEDIVYPAPPRPSAKPPMRAHDQASKTKTDEPKEVGRRRSSPAAQPTPQPDEDDMSPQERERLERIDKNLELLIGGKKLESATAAAAANPPDGAVHLEQLYQEIKRRLLAEEKPALLRLAATSPELVVAAEPQRMTATAEQPRGRVALLIAQGFFKNARIGKDAYDHWKNRGFTSSSARIYEALASLTADGFLVKSDGDKYQQAAGLIVKRQGEHTATLIVDHNA